MTERCRWTVYFRATGRVLKIQIIQGWQRDDSALAAEFCTGPHNRLLRRQHCSSLCLQSEGHEHVANIASALGHIFVGFLAVFGRHNIRPPHFASKVSYSASPQTFAECSRSASCRGNIYIGRSLFFSVCVSQRVKIRISINACNHLSRVRLGWLHAFR